MLTCLHFLFNFKLGCHAAQTQDRYVALHMKTEVISEIRVLESKKLLLKLESLGHSSYQHIYREATGVYWDSALNGFISTIPQQWSYSVWFNHVLNVTKGIGIYLKLTDKTIWDGIDELEKRQIINDSATNS